jgi:SAM-dependent methyltransferase
MNQIPFSSSITHSHILNVLNTLIIKQDSNSKISILDAGCGNGDLMGYLQDCLGILHPKIEFNIYGFDVTDHGVQKEGFILSAIDKLNKKNPNQDWSGKIYTFTADQIWDFNGLKFDFIISNQVLEHVKDKNLFFCNINNSLVDGGHSVNLAPLKHIVQEGHIFIPFSHKFKNYGGLLGYIKFMSRLGIGKFRKQRLSGVNLDEWAERHADYIYFWTSYSTESETLELARKNNLRADFRFSIEFFITKARQVLKLPRGFSYVYRECGFYDVMVIKILRYISSVTLVLKKSNKY